VAVTLTLTGASGTFTMSLNPGSPVGTYYPIVNERNLFSVTVTAAVTAPPPPPPAPRQVVEQIPEPKLTAITPIVEKQANPYVTLNGAQTTAVVQANTSQNGMEVVANGWGLSLAVIEPNGNPAPLSSNRSLVLNEDQQVRVSGPGFKPNTEVHVYLFSTPRLIGTTTTDSNGNFVGIFPMLKDVAVGNHLIQVNGISPDNQVRSTTLPAIYEKAKSPIAPTINNLVFVVPFSSNKYTLNNSQMAILKSVKQVKAAKIQVIGYAQPSSAQADIALSLDRALEVKKAVSKIVPKANFITRGSGPKSQPLCAKYKNKCVVVTITQG
jgi:outer membrane protein OmpA-like peptidoglycan-associated protein